MNKKEPIILIPSYLDLELLYLCIHIYLLDAYTNAGIQYRIVRTHGMSLPGRFRYIWSIFEIHLLVNCTYQCTEYILRTNEYKRSAGYQMSTTDTAISDYFMEEGWYRFESAAGNDMVTEAPSLSSCGTLFPIWLQGTIPSVADGVVNRSACVRGLHTPCETTISIQIQNCSDYRLYYLRPPSKTGYGYCIGDEVQCPVGKGSETGFTPGCKDVPDVNVTSLVVSSVDYGEMYLNSWGRSVIPVFKCEFEPNDGNSFVYDIYWYINRNNVIAFKNTSFENLTSTWLRPDHWTKQYDLNMVVSCSVRLRYIAGSPPGRHFLSQDFAAGIFPTDTSYSVKEGEEEIIKFKVTVPVGCLGENLGCSAMLFVLTPTYQSDVTCTNYTNKDAVSFAENKCGLSIKSGPSVLNKGVSLHVIGNVDNIINVADRKVYIGLGARRDDNGHDTTGVWDNVTLPDIKILVMDNDQRMEDKDCYANTDPRMRTFDGIEWSANHAGEFVMYRNKKRNIAIHSLFTSCGEGGFCNCGIAVKVEDSLYVYRTCGQISYSYTNALIHHSLVYEVCDDQNLIVEKNRNDITTIRLPTGTTVKYNVRNDFLQWTYIIPSSLDWDNVEGICGNPNGNETDDFIERGSNSPSSNYESVLLSWRIQPDDPDESLFIENPNLDNGDNSDTLRTYCSCHTEAEGNGPNNNWMEDFENHYTANCNITAAMVECSSQNTDHSFTKTCRKFDSRSKRDDRAHRRIRRSLTDSDDIIDFIPLSYDPHFDFNYKPPIPEWRNGWNESKARDFCEKNILSDPAKRECEKHIEIRETSNEAVRECILDIRDSGTVDWLEGTISSIKSICNTKIRKHEKFHLVNDTDDIPLVDKFSSFICSNNCSGKGRCIKGKCECNDGYINSDCSRRKDIPPSGASIPENGLCKRTFRRCVKTNIMGTFYSETIYTRCQYFRITEAGKSVHESHIISATYRNPTLISVTFPSPRQKRHADEDHLAYGYNIQLSYDGLSFGNNMTILIYDDSCIACNESLQCTQLKTECLTTTQSTTKSQLMEATKSDDDNALTEFFNKKSDYTLLIALCVSAVCIIALVIGILILKSSKILKRSSSGKKIYIEHSAEQQQAGIIYQPNHCSKPFWTTVDPNIKDIER